jgi:hypothetical protein
MRVDVAKIETNGNVIEHRRVGGGFASGSVGGNHDLKGEAWKAL